MHLLVDLTLMMSCEKSGSVGSGLTSDVELLLLSSYVIALSSAKISL